MFYATPDQKANVNMYGNYYPNGIGPNRPSTQQVQSSANQDQADRNLMGGGVIAAATVAHLLLVVRLSRPLVDWGMPQLAE
ncbi:hypothetical protein [Burkholderia multivorans]|uniref:hypothetical protein n=1 Tax=Burkholderia multivorans TaxID=87883 RepID=UPI001C219082|nr:hypothetical protein [Burkholderia multivorans]MBU9283849.1 hypothetical protein [Burkholderia multivorans]